MMKLNVMSNVHPNVIRISSTMTNHMPRVSRYRAVCLGFRFFIPYKKEDVPARKTNTGAQKCVIQRVKKSRGVVVERFVGSTYQIPYPKYMRVWSNAMMT